MKKALIFGVNGQDGFILQNFIIKKYTVHGTRRYSSINNIKNLSNVVNNKNFKLHYADVTDSSNIQSILNMCRPDEIYNLAAQSHVHVSFYSRIYCKC